LIDDQIKALKTNEDQVIELNKQIVTLESQNKKFNTDLNFNNKKLQEAIDDNLNLKNLNKDSEEQFLKKEKDFHWEIEELSGKIQKLETQNLNLNNELTEEKNHFKRMITLTMIF